MKSVIIIAVLILLTITLMIIPSVDAATNGRLTIHFSQKSVTGDQPITGSGKLTDSEVKRQVSTSDIVLKGEVIATFSMLGKLFRDLVLNTIKEPEEQRKIIYGFSSLVETHLGNIADEDKED